MAARRPGRRVAGRRLVLEGLPEVAGLPVPAVVAVAQAPNAVGRRVAAVPRGAPGLAVAVLCLRGVELLVGLVARPVRGRPQVAAIPVGRLLAIPVAVVETGLDAVGLLGHATRGLHTVGEVLRRRLAPIAATLGTAVGATTAAHIAGLVASRPHSFKGVSWEVSVHSPRKNYERPIYFTTILYLHLFMRKRLCFPTAFTPSMSTYSSYFLRTYDRHLSGTTYCGNTVSTKVLYFSRVSSTKRSRTLLSWTGSVPDVVSNASR